MAKARRCEEDWTIKRLREVWNYDPQTGGFDRKEKQRGGSKPSLRGDVGGITLTGYRLISFDGTHYLAHRLAWAYVNGEWPDRAVEHINGNRLDNRIENLREKWGAKKPLSPERLRQIFDFDEVRGHFIWKVRTPRSEIGDIAGGQSGNGYWTVSIDGKRMLAHRVVWFWAHGKWPSKHVDHINGDRLDNRLSNLRDVSNSRNTHNTTKLRKTNKLGLRGVSQQRNRYLSRISVDNRVINLGSYSTAEDAYAARLEAEKKYGVER